MAICPDVAKAGVLVATVGAPPRSWATLGFNSLNTFRLVDADDVGRWVRWRLDPEAGEHALAEEEWAGDRRPRLPDDRRARRAADPLPPARAAGRRGRPDHRPSKAWPADGAWVEMGTVEMTGPDETRERDGDVLVHDPMRLVDGIEPSDDPILRIRSHVYAESVRRRGGGPPPAHLGRPRRPTSGGVVPGGRGG